MRVLHLTSGNLYGGVERALATVAAHRHAVPDMLPTFGLCFRGRIWDELAATGVPLIDLGPVRVSRPWTVLRARRRVAEAAKTFDVAVTHSNWPHAVFAAALPIPVVNWVHGELTGRGWVERWASRTKPRRVIANSEFIRGTVKAVFPDVPVEVVYYPVEPARGDPAGVRAKLDTPADAVVILQASRLERWKGQAVLIDSLVRLKDEPGWVCWVAGGPQMAGEQQFLDELTAAARPVADRVRFLGQRSDVPALLAASDIFCQPNTGPEPFGIVYIEALSAGRPVVASDFGGAAEIVTPGCGVLTPPGDAAAVAEALRGLIRDAAKRTALRAGGPARAAELTDPATQLRRLAEVLAA